MNTATVIIPGMDATPAATAWRAYQGVSPAAVDEKDLIERYLPLVRNVVDRIKLNVPAHVDADDLYSVGIIGLIAAVRRFDPKQGSTFRAATGVACYLDFDGRTRNWRDGLTPGRPSGWASPVSLHDLAHACRFDG